MPIYTPSNPNPYAPPPVGYQSGPYVVFQPMSPQQHFEYRRKINALNREYMKHALKERFPSVYVAIHSILIILISLAAIALQIVLIVNNGAINFVGAGIWGGAVGLILAASYLFLSNSTKVQYISKNIYINDSFIIF